MAKLLRDTATASAGAYFAGFVGQAEVRFRVTVSPKGISVLGEDPPVDGCLDLVAAQAAVAEFFALQAETMVFGVTRDVVGLGIGMIGPAPAQPTQEGTPREDVQG